ncbi:MAG: DUF479 domain-containing protein [Gammaproteobacteria bacterium]|nr:DUF479 domain-containing protein [Gammaproteobacteria bacterium]
MNFLAHLWLTEQARLPLAGAVLGDVVRGRLEGRFPAELERSIRLHRRVDALTDRHPLVVRARERFAPGARRYAGVVLDVLADHVLARRWECFGDAPLEDFARRAARDVGQAAAWFEAAGVPVPAAPAFAALLLSYRDEAGIERALHRIARRLSEPRPLLAAADGWPAHAAALADDLAALLADLRAAARGFTAAHLTLPAI